MKIVLVEVEWKHVLFPMLSLLPFSDVLLSVPSTGKAWPQKLFFFSPWFFVVPQDTSYESACAVALYW